jgi:dynein heavy chain
LEKGLAKMEAAWETLAFVTKEWRTSYILVSTDEIQQELDDQIVKTQAMRGSSASQRPKHLARPPKATV